MSKKNIIIIGSGVAGLASAIRLSNLGYFVRVFESNNYVGGKISEIRQKGYRFDTGPSLFTLPKLMDELISMSHNKTKIFFDYHKIDKSCRYFFNDGTIFNAYSDRDKFVKEAVLKTKTKSSIVINYLNYVDFLYRSTSKVFIEKSLHKISTYLSLETFYSFFKIPFLGIFASMDKVNKKKLKNSKLIKIFNRFATYNGSNPYCAPGILNVISHLELNDGVFLPKNGMRSIVDTLHKICVEKGVIFELSSKVDEICFEKDKVNGVYANGHHFSAEIIISNIDIHYVYNNLLKRQPQFKNISKNQRSTSAIVFYWGVTKIFNQLCLHNILFAEKYKKEFDEIQNSFSIQSDPTIYINITSKHIKSDAPMNCENWFVMINVSHNKGQNWNLLVQEARKKIISKINRFLDTDIEKYIEYENSTNPDKIQLNTGAYKGSLYGTSSNNVMSAFLRHPNFNNKIQNLYFCGGTVHPGGGIPLALNSAKIVADEILSNEK